MNRLAIVTTHPIQYYAPLFRMLHERGNLDIHVFYTAGGAGKFDRGFKKDITWDIPLLEGYPHTFVENTSSNPGSHHFTGIRNRGLIKLIKDFTPDAILLYGWAYISHLHILHSFSKRIPVWFRGDSTLIDKHSLITRTIRSLVLRWVYRYADLAFYAGSANKAYFEEYGFAAKQLLFAPHAIDNERFGINRSNEASELRLKLGIGPHEVLVLFTGKFESKKSPLALIHAFNALQANDVHLLLAGDGELYDEILAQASGNRKIHICPFVNQADIPVYYQACNLFCLPSGGPGESWGLAVNEAMAAGKAVLVSDKAGCATDLVKNNENGMVFCYESEDDLFNCLRKLVSDSKRLEAMGKISAGIIADYSFIRQAIAIESAFKQ